MPYRYVEPEVYLTHQGVSVFHVYREGTDEPWSYWFTSDPRTADQTHAHGSGGHFDARMFAARWSDTPTVQQWDDYWRPRWRTEADAINALVVMAIEAGKVTNATDAERATTRTGGNDGP